MFYMPGTKMLFGDARETCEGEMPYFCLPSSAPWNASMGEAYILPNLQLTSASITCSDQERARGQACVRLNRRSLRGRRAGDFPHIFSNCWIVHCRIRTDIGLAFLPACSPCTCCITLASVVCMYHYLVARLTLSCVCLPSPITVPQRHHSILRFRRLSENACRHRSHTIY